MEILAKFRWCITNFAQQKQWIFCHHWKFHFKAGSILTWINELETKKKASHICILFFSFKIKKDYLVIEHTFLCISPPALVTQQQHHSVSLSVTQHQSASLSVTQNQSASLSMTQRHSASLSVTQHHSESLSITQRHSASLSVTQCHSKSLTVT